VQIAVYRRMSGAQRVALAIEMSEAAQAISRCRARSRAAALVRSDVTNRAVAGSERRHPPVPGTGAPALSMKE